MSEIIDSEAMLRRLYRPRTHTGRLLTITPPFTGRELSNIRRTLGLLATEVAELTGLDASTVSRAEDSVHGQEQDREIIAEALRLFILTRWPRRQAESATWHAGRSGTRNA